MEQITRDCLNWSSETPQVNAFQEESGTGGGWHLAHDFGTAIRDLASPGLMPSQAVTPGVDEMDR